MTVLIDCSALKMGGGIQVALSFLYDLKELQVDKNFIVVMSTEFSTALVKKGFGSNFSFITLKKEETSLFSKRKLMKRIEKRNHLNVIFTVFGPSSHSSKMPKIVGYALPHYIYLDSPFYEILSVKERIRLKIMKRIRIWTFKRNSDYLTFETEDSRNIFCSTYNFPVSRTFVVSNRLNHLFLNKTNWNRNPFNFNCEFKILCLAANYKHKNLRIIPMVIKYLKDDFQLKNFKFIISQTKDQLNFPDECDPNIEYLGKVPLERLPTLYQAVDVLFMPTLLEIFSTTYLEAMHMEVPIVTSNLSFAKDICQDAALYFNPLDPQEGGEKILQILRNQEIAKNLQEKGLNNLQRFGTSLERTKSYLKIIDLAFNKNGMA